MTDATADNPPAGPLNSSEYAQRLKKRHDAEWRFRAYGLGAIFIGLAFLVTLLYTIVSEGAPAFLQSEIRLNVTFDKAEIDPTGTGNYDDLMKADYAAMVRQALREQLGNVGNDRASRAAAHRLLSSGADLQAREIVLRDRTAIGKGDMGGSAANRVTTALSGLDTTLLGELRLAVQSRSRSLRRVHAQVRESPQDRGSHPLGGSVHAAHFRG